MASSGNFCTLNPLTQPNSGTFSEGNLLFTHTAGAWRTTAGTMCMTTGKWYWEAYQYEDLVGNGFVRKTSTYTGSGITIGQAYNKGNLVVLSKKEASDSATGKRR